MSIMKRIATARQWNETLTGGRSDPEIAAMRRLYQSAVVSGVGERDAHGA